MNHAGIFDEVAFEGGVILVEDELEYQSLDDEKERGKGAPFATTPI